MAILQAVAATAVSAALAVTPAPAAKTITLTAADNGRHIHVHRGEYVLVGLRLDPRTDPTTWWHAIDESGRPLRTLPQIAMSMRGTTLGRFRAVARGEATLESSRSVCPQHGAGPTCHSMQGWHVTVEVR